MLTPTERNLAYLSRSLQALGRLDKALAAARHWIERRPVHAEGWCLLGDLYRAVGERDSARVAFEKALEFGAGTAQADSARARLVAMGNR